MQSDECVEFMDGLLIKVLGQEQELILITKTICGSVTFILLFII